jgi:hypothetical protein
MNFKRFNDIGDCEPRAWNKSAPGTRFALEDDEEDYEIPVPYCDEFEEEESEEENEQEDEVDTETETDSVTSSGKPVKRVFVSIVLQEESDFMTE